MMKPKDTAVATALIIQGYMRANEEGNIELSDCIRAIVQECCDWGENLTDEEWDRSFKSVVDTYNIKTNDALAD